MSVQAREGPGRGESTKNAETYGDDHGVDGAEVGRTGRAAVESKPAKPEEDGAEDDVRDRVGLVGEPLGAVPPPLAEVESDGKRGRSRRDVDRGAALASSVARAKVSEERKQVAN